jgi:hypothetical protein
MPQRGRLITGVALCVTVMAAASIDTAVLAQADRDSAAQKEPRVVAESRFAVTNAPAQTDLVQLVVDFEPGAWTSLHTHGGQAINLVLEGEITLRHAGMDRPYNAGSRGPTVPAKFTRQATQDLAKPGCSRIFCCRRARLKSRSCRNLNLDRRSPMKQSFRCRRLQRRPRLCSK